MGIKKVYTEYQIMYYPKFYYELNHVKYFQYDRKSQTWHYCKYTIKRLREDIPKTLSLVKSSIILEHYKNCLKKINLYREKVIYRTRK